MTPALQLKRLFKHFGGIQAVQDVNLTVMPGERRAIIGPNGAGKTTLFHLISGILPLSSGAVLLGDREISQALPEARARLGMGRTFQRNNLFLGLSVFENVRLAVQQQQGVATRFFRPAASYQTLQSATDAILTQLGLQEWRDQPVRQLAYGQQRALEVALALAIQPHILLLDEPTAGMSPVETEAMVRLIERLPRTLTLLIVEHDMDVVFTLADRITVMHYGAVLAEGTPDEVRNNAEVQKIYLGTADQ